MTEYELFLSDIIEVLKELGEPVTITNYSKTFDQSTGQLQTTITSQSSSFGVGYPISSDDLINTDVKKSDIKIITHKLSLVPNLDSSVLFNSKTYKIVSINSTRVYNNDIVYEMVVRV